MTMTELAQIPVRTRRIRILHTSGEVMEARKWTVTEISGGGGGGAVYGTNGNVYGGSHTNPIKSETTTHDQFFVRCTDGKERVLKFANKDVQARAGNWVTLLLAIPEGKDAGEYVAVVNHDTGQLDILSDGVKAMCASPFAKLLALVAAAVTLIGIGLFATSSEPGSGLHGLGLGVAWAMLLVPLPAFFIWRERQRGRFERQVRALCGKIADPRPAVTGVPARA